MIPPRRGAVYAYVPMDSTPVETVTVDALRARICRVLPAQIRAAVDALDDEQIWWRPNETSNSVGNLVLHLSGSLNHDLNHKIGGMDYARDRAAEFAERRHVPRAELMAIFDGMVANAEKTFDALTFERLAEPATDLKLYRLIVEEVLGILTHLANHTGQIVWIAKALKEGALDEVWMRTHKRLGGWRSA